MPSVQKCLFSAHTIAQNIALPIQARERFYRRRNSLLMPSKHWTLLEAGPPKSQPLLKSLLPVLYSFTCFSHFLCSGFSCTSSGKEELFLGTEICASWGIFRPTAASQAVHSESTEEKAEAVTHPSMPRDLYQRLSTGNFYVFQHENKALLLTEISSTADSISWCPVK